MVYNLSSNSSGLDELLFLPVGGYEPEFCKQLPNFSPIVDTFRGASGYSGSMESVTGSSSVVKFSGLDRSSAVFTSNGPKRTKLQAYSVRISELRHIAADDGYSLNLTSEADFWSFVEFDPRLTKGNLVLMDSGNLRAVWKDGQGTRLGLQFLGGGMVQYVIFKQREPTKPISRVAGRDTFAGVRRQIEAFELHTLLYQ